MKTFGFVNSENQLLIVTARFLFFRKRGEELQIIKVMSADVGRIVHLPAVRTAFEYDNPIFAAGSGQINIDMPIILRTVGTVEKILIFPIAALFAHKIKWNIYPEFRKNIRFTGKAKPQPDGPRRRCLSDKRSDRKANGPKRTKSPRPSVPRRESIPTSNGISNTDPARDKRSLLHCIGCNKPHFPQEHDSR